MNPFCDIMFVEEMIIKQLKDKTHSMLKDIISIIKDLSTNFHSFKVSSMIKQLKLIHTLFSTEVNTYFMSYIELN